MRLLMFPQWDKLSALLRTMARQSAADYCQRNIVRLEPKGGRVQLTDRAVNVLAVEGNAPERSGGEVAEGDREATRKRPRDRGGLPRFRLCPHCASACLRQLGFASADIRQASSSSWVITS